MTSHGGSTALFEVHEGTSAERAQQAATGSGRLWLERDTGITYRDAAVGSWVEAYRDPATVGIDALGVSGQYIRLAVQASAPQQNGANRRAPAGSLLLWVKSGTPLSLRALTAGGVDQAFG
jgi:hypothetical protein